MAHTHRKPIFFANNKIVCEVCILPEDKGKNECFCKCHQEDKLSCSNCKVFHGEV
jgi:hypothetical protein